MRNHENHDKIAYSIWQKITATTKTRLPSAISTCRWLSIVTTGSTVASFQLSSNKQRGKKIPLKYIYRWLYEKYNFKRHLENDTRWAHSYSWTLTGNRNDLLNRAIFGDLSVVSGFQLRNLSSRILHMPHRIQVQKEDMREQLFNCCIQTEGRFKVIGCHVALSS